MSIERTTVNFNLRVPNYDEPQWHVPVDENWDILDGTLGMFARVSNIRGPWKNATTYSIGDRVIDVASGYIYETSTDHTSSSTNTFAEERIADDTLWDRLDQFDTDPAAPSFTIIESNDVVPSVNGSLANAIDSTVFGASNAGWVGKGLYVRRTNETQAEYDARLADSGIAEGAVYRYLGPEGFRVTQQRTTGFTLTPSFISQRVYINAATTQNVTFNVGVLRDDQKSHVAGVTVHAWGDLFIDSSSSDITAVAGTGVTFHWSNGQATNVIPKGRDIRWRYEYNGEDDVTVYFTSPDASADAVSFDEGESGAVGPDVQTSLRNLGDRTAVLEAGGGGGGGVGSIVTLPEDVITSAFDLDEDNALFSLRSGILHLGTIIPVDTSGGAVTGTIVGSVELEGDKWEVYKTGSAALTIKRPQTWPFIRGGTITTGSDLITMADRSGIVAGMAISTIEEGVLTGGETVLDANPEAGKIQISANAIGDATDVDFILDPGEVGEINGVEGDGTLRLGSNIIKIVAVGETTGPIIEISSDQNTLDLDTTVTVSREFALTDLGKSLQCNHATVAIVMTMGTAMANAPKGSWIEVEWAGVAAVSLAESGTGDLDYKASDTLALAEKGSTALLVHRGGNVWRLTGDMVAA